MFSKLLQAIIPSRWRPYGYLANLVLDRTNRRVATGPFTGMRYIETSHYSTYLPKLLGIYEKELAGCIEEAIARWPDAVIDVGAAEGYYAVGLAVRCPEARVIAYEMVDEARQQLRDLAVLNQVENRIEMRGRCDPPDLAAALENTVRPLIICDVEGYESVLLDPGAVGGLAKASILVELHDFAVRGIAETLGKRFASTHRVAEIWQVPRSASDFPYSTWYTALLPKSYLEWTVGELRQERMSWLWMEPS